MRILNLYAGIGGNRAKWGDEHEITAVEFDPQIASAYKLLWPKDAVIVGDAHQYLIDHHGEFDFIWTSPPCQTHTRMQLLRVKGYGDAPKFPSGMLFEEVVFLANWSNTPYVVENVIPYYKQWIPGAQKIARHLYWASYGIPLKNKRQVLRNCVSPDVGRHILAAAVASLGEAA